MVYRCVINSVVMWLRLLLGPCWCVYIALFGSCSRIPTELITRRCTIVVYFHLLAPEFFILARPVYKM